jgi:hypothetical protein
LRQRIQLPDGRTLLAALPEGVGEGKHFGPALIAYILLVIGAQKGPTPLPAIGK